MMQRFESGEIVGEYASNALNSLFSFYEEILKQTVAKVACRSFAELLLNQYDESDKILHGKGLDDIALRLEWKEIEGNFRRALKYLLELVCAETPGDVPKIPEHLAIQALETSLFCVESVTALAEMSERLHSVFPDQFFVRLDYSRPGQFLDVRISGENEGFDERFYERIRIDRRNRDKFVEQPQFDLDPRRHFEVLDDCFRAEYGGSYNDFLGVLRAVIDHTEPLKDGFRTYFLHREQLIAGIVEASGMPEQVVVTALDGFTIFPMKMVAEKRVAWNPKQRHRALRRGFFLFPHESGDHLAFSRTMALENSIHLISSIPYQKVPIEWETPSIRKNATKLSKVGADWFEVQVQQNLGRVGVRGSRAGRRIGQGDSRVAIPDSVGEIDFIGYSSAENLILVLECKMALTGLEARFWRDDLDRFVNRKHSYREQLLRKVAWVRSNLESVSRAMGVPNDARLATAMVSLYPCIADEVIAEFRLVSITELMLDYERSGGWPYHILEGCELHD